MSGLPWTVIEGDCVTAMQAMDADSVDAIVTDPPYGLQFMGKEWDALWRNQTDADRAYVERTTAESDGLTARRRNLPDLRSTGREMQDWHERWAREALRVAKPGAHLVAFGGTRTHHRLMVAIEDAGWEIRDCLMWLYGSGFPKSLDVSKVLDKADGRQGAITPNTGKWKGGQSFGGGPTMYAKDGETTKPVPHRPISDLARQWDGWGTALKPAYEPIILARKPLAGTVAATVARYGTGAINVDGCRIGTDDDCAEGGLGSARTTFLSPADEQRYERPTGGRWPANLLLGEDAAAALGEVSRYFYTAKASRSEREAGLNGITASHPTVKPLALMRWLVRLVTPPGGLVLDPFLGSGTTLVAATELGFRSIGIEREAEYAEIARRRIAAQQPGLPLVAADD